MSETDWIDMSVGELPTGTVTLLLADVEGSTRLWENQSNEMTAAVAQLDQVLAEVVVVHHGVRPVEQGEGDSFVIAFARASDAVACALALQCAPLTPILLRVGLHTGEVQLRDEGNYVGPTINRTARLRDLAHGGQTVMSGTTSDLVLDRLPDGAHLIELGTHPLRDLPRPERVVQLRHPELRAEFPPLRSAIVDAAQRLPTQLTTFVGRANELTEVRRILAANRLVTLSGAGGVGKTRLAIEVASLVAADYGGGVHYVDLAAITDPDVVPIATVRALGLTDKLGFATTDTLIRFIGDRHILVVLDNCEHLLDASADLVTTLTVGCPHLKMLATSREPIGVAHEVTWRVPSLPLADDALELFADRARLTTPGFRITDDNVAIVSDICRRLDGMPLAIELAAARVRALTLTEISDSLHDRFRLLTGGNRRAVRRQQTLWASVDWSHALLTDAERILFRRLAVFMAGFDLDAARAVTAGRDVEPHQVLDQITLLVDKSLVVAADTGGRTRYRLLETVRQYAQERLGVSGEAHSIRTAHRDYYASRAATLDMAFEDPRRWRVGQADRELDNLRAAFEWSLDEADIEAALKLASALWGLWVSRGLIREARTWYDTALANDQARYPGIDGATWSRALADKVMLDAMAHSGQLPEEAYQALKIARDVGDQELIARALTACASTATFDPEAARPYVEEAIGVARESGDRWWLSQILAWQCAGAYYSGDPHTAHLAGTEGRDLADALGDQFVSHACRWGVIWSELVTGDARSAAMGLLELANDAKADGDGIWAFSGYYNAVEAFARLGDVSAARAAVDHSRAAADDVGGQYYAQYLRMTEGFAALATEDAARAGDEYEVAWNELRRDHPMSKMNVWRLAVFALARGELESARHWADAAVHATTNWHLVNALAVRARVAIAQGDTHQAERDAHRAIALADKLDAQLAVPDALECLACSADDPLVAARLVGAAEALRQRTGEVRLPAYRAVHDTEVERVRNELGESDFATAWAEGAGLSTAEALAYAQRGRGERRRPTSGWESITPAEVDVVRLVCEGLANKDIATRLFVSPRTVQAHLTHVYAKLNITSRAQLIQLSAQRS